MALRASNHRLIYRKLAHSLPTPQLLRVYRDHHLLPQIIVLKGSRNGMEEMTRARIPLFFFFALASPVRRVSVSSMRLQNTPPLFPSRSVKAWERGGRVDPGWGWRCLDIRVGVSSRRGSNLVTVKIILKLTCPLVAGPSVHPSIHRRLTPHRHSTRPVVQQATLLEAARYTIRAVGGCCSCIQLAWLCLSFSHLVT